MTAATTISPVSVRKKCPGAPASTRPTWIMPKVMAPEHRADDAAVAAGQKRAADHGDGHRLELDALAAQRVDRREPRHLDDAGDRGEAGGEHEQDERDAIDRHAEVARRLLVLPARLDPVAESGPQQQERRRARR